MVEEHIMRVRNQNRQLIQLSNRGRSNSVAISAANTIDHERLKFEVCFILSKKGYEFYTECHFETGGIADIFILDRRIILEILATETDEKFQIKIKKYPEYVLVFPIHDICEAVTIIEGWE